MIALTTLVASKGLQNVFKLAKQGEVTVQIHYNRRVYQMTVKPTNETYNPQREYYLRRIRTKKAGIKLETQICPKCGSPEVGGICISKSCSKIL